MEFLGDSVVGLILTEALFNEFPDENEGALSKKRAVFIRGSSLAKIARSLNLDKHILMSSAEIKREGNYRDSTLEDAIEALAGAIFLDGGMKAVKGCVLKWFGNLSEVLSQEQSKYNPKGQLQELIKEQGKNTKIQYHLSKESGPPHKKVFVIDLIVGKKTLGTGTANSKKEAEEIAALQGLSLLRSRKQLSKK